MLSPHAQNHRKHEESKARQAQTLVDIAEMSRRLGNIAIGTLYNWVYQRRIPFRKVGRCLRFDPEEVLSALPRNPVMIDPAGRGSKEP